MVERYTVIDKRPIGFAGYFKTDDLFKVLRRFFKERGYFPLERRNLEEVYEHGRQVEIELRPFKQISDYLKQEMVLRIKLSNLKEKTITLDGVKRKMMHGKVSFVVDAVIVSDLKSKWEGTGWLYFLRILNDKFIRKDWVSRVKDAVAKDCNDMLDEVRSYLNMIKFKIDR